MKKFLIGCAIVVVLTVGLMVGCFVFVGYKINQVATGWEESAKKISAVDEKYKWTKPAEDALTADRVDEFFAIRKAMIDKIASNPTVQKLAQAQKDGKQADVGVMEMLGLFSTEARAWLDEFGAQLDAHQMGPREFAHQARVVYRTIAQAQKNGDAAMTDLIEKMRAGIEEVNAKVANGNNKQNRVDFDYMLHRLTDTQTPLGAGNLDAVRAHADQLLQFPWLAYLEMKLFEADVENKGFDSKSVPPPVQVEWSTEDGKPEGT